MKSKDLTIAATGARNRGRLTEQVAGNEPAVPPVSDASPDGLQDGDAKLSANSSDGLGRIMTSGRFPKFQNDRAALEIRIGAREFNCIGASPPHDHPHVYINMGSKDSILCPYCVTRYRYDSSLGPFEADPQDCVYVEPAIPA